MSKYRVSSGLYFPAFGLNTERYYLSVFSPNAGKYGPERTPYLDTFHKMNLWISVCLICCTGTFCTGTGDFSMTSIWQFMERIFPGNCLCYSLKAYCFIYEMDYNFYCPLISLTHTRIVTDQSIIEINTSHIFIVIIG